MKNNRKHTLFTHDLLRLATKAELEINEETEEWLDEISTFNINARYDSYAAPLGLLSRWVMTKPPNPLRWLYQAR